MNPPLLLIFLIPLFTMMLQNLDANAIPVRIEETADGFRLLREGRPYFIKGAGASAHLEALAVAGGNSLRTWGSDQTEALIDQAHALGLTVTAGLWIEHERHQFDYNNKELVAAQIERHKAAVDRFKDHPALLLWAVGNEVWMEAGNEKVWDVIETVAAYIKKTDPAHPVMTVLPHVSKEEVTLIKARCPSIDLLGFNSYAGLPAVARDARRFGWKGPFIITEWGTDGAWEVPKTSWGAEIEPTTTQKAQHRIERYTWIRDDPSCLGGYAFLWGQKQETTPTWFNLFLEDGTPVGGVDALQFLWTGSYPESKAPEISPLRLNELSAHDNVICAPGTSVNASFSLLASPSGTPSVRWECLPESNDKRAGGDREERPPSIPITVEPAHPTLAHFIAPATPGAYRLFVYVTFPQGKSASANIPFLVR